MFLPVVLFIIGLILLVRGGDKFVDGAVGLAHRFRLPELLIGATIVSIGTTLPEVMVSTQAAIEHNAGISYGNAIGSVICNTSLIAALTVTFQPGKIKRSDLILPSCFFFGSAVINAVFAYVTGRFTRWQGLLLLTVFVIYMVVTVLHMKRHPDEEEEIEELEEIELGNVKAIEESPVRTDILRMLVGAVAIALGAKLLVDNGTLIAQALGVPDSVIGLTMVALGTSLPELITAITSLIKGHSALSLGNVIGANLFNIVLVSGASITISPFSIPAEKMINGINSSLLIDLPVMFFVMLLLTLPALIKEKLYRWQGILLLCVYAAFTIYQFVS